MNVTRPPIPNNRGVNSPRTARLKNNTKNTFPKSEGELSPNSAAYAKSLKRLALSQRAGTNSTKSNETLG